jgi:ABC-2 type transport system permease protein
MQKIWLIVQREYITRVQKRSFIIMSILGPVLLALVMVLPIWLASSAGDNKLIEVVDESGLFTNKFSDTEKLKFIYSNSALEDAKSNLSKNNYDGLLYIPQLDLNQPKGIALFSEKSPSPMLQSMIEKTIKREIEDLKLSNSGIDKTVLDNIRTAVDIKTITLSDDGEKANSSDAAMIIGYLGGMLIYFFIFLYGAQIMRGVIEEKTNRIVEVVISSVKPFQLMMGKILGVGAVALTQFFIWVVLSMAVTSAVSSFFNLSRFESEQISQTMGQIESTAGMEKAMKVNEVLTAAASVNIPLVVACFAFYFLGGYLMYGALFGAVGAAVDNETDSQQFMLPITMPLLLSIISLSAVIADPNGTLAFWLSVFPLTAPVVMMIRIPFIGASWDLYLSAAILIGAFIGAVWLAGRIYRVGILMYGKKPTYKEIGKWLFYKA